MKESLSNNKKIKLSKEQQLMILKFFVKTSIPRMLKFQNKEIK